MVPRKKKPHEEEHENHERWLVSYADFITLLFAFFVVMYSVSRVDNKRLAMAANAIAWALHFEGTGGVGTMPIFEGPPSEGGCATNIGQGRKLTPADAQKPLETLRKKVERRLRPFLIEKNTPPSVTVQIEGRRLSIRLAASRFFDQGQSALRPDALPVLDAIADEIVPLRRPLRVEGHTDDQGIAGGRFRNNWDLSASRAVTVVSYLETAHRVNPELLAAVGLGSTKPITKAATPEARELNRRVELAIEIDPGDVLDLVPGQGAPGASR